MVDISNLKAGDRVKFRNGSIETVANVKHYEGGFDKHLVRFNHVQFTYGNNGEWMKLGEAWDFDIMEIIPKKSKVARRLAKIIDGLPLCETRKIEGVTIKLRDHSTYDVVSVFRPFAHAIQIALLNEEINAERLRSYDEDGKSQYASEFDIVHIRFEPPEEKALRYTEDAIKVTVLEPRGFEQVAGRRSEEIKPTNAIPASLLVAGEYHMSPDGTVTPITTKKETTLNKASERAAQSINDDSDLKSRLHSVLSDPTMAARATIKVSNGLTIDEIIIAHHETLKSKITGNYVIDAYSNLFRIWDDLDVTFDGKFQGKVTSIEFNPLISMDDHHDQPNVITDDKAVNALDNEIPDDQKGFDPKTAEKGLRYNKSKLRLDLIPPEMIEGVASVLGYGAAKYADRNWEKGMSWMETLASLKRHCLAFEKGEAIDGEGMTEEERKEAGKSGLPHVDHIATNAAFLQTFFARGIGADDRVVLEPKKTVDRNEGDA